MTAPAARHRVIGAAVLLVVLLATVALATRADRFGDTRSVSAAFGAAESLGPLEIEVRVAGTPVGRVVGRRRVGGDAVLRMDVERSAGPIGVDAEAEIRPRSTLEGAAFVELRPGTAAEPLGNRTIPRSRTRSYVSISESLSILRAPTRSDVRADVRTGRSVLATAGRDGLREALDAGPRLTRFGALAARAAQGPRGDELAGAVRGLAATTAGLAGEQRRLGGLITGADRTASALSVDGGRALDQVLEETPARLETLRSGSLAVRRLLDRVEPLAVDLRAGAAELAPTLRTARPPLREARPILAEAPPLLADLRGTLDLAARAAPPARRVARTLRPSLQLLDGSILPELERETALGLPSYLQLLSAAQGGGGSVRPFERGEGEGREVGHFMRASARPVSGGEPVSCAALAATDAELASALAAAGGCRP
jgi:phospholipid/cholesterol/gamma-HCH transport system substrate-binding protein